ncbi:MAG: esterase family protein [Alistipes sp.]|nr:esterase family protein [Alistipes sp.]
MRRISILVMLFFVAIFAVNAQSQVKHLTLKSEVLGVEKSYSVYLPDGYEKSTERYPVLYLLHGAYGTNLSWVDERFGNMRKITDEEIASGRAKKMIVVMPDARGIGKRNAEKNMGYFNVENWNYEEFFFKEFIPHIDQTLRTIAEKKGRSIAGLSMGGGGAVVYAQRHPEIFGAAYSTSGLLDHRYRPLMAGNFDSTWTLSVARTSPVEFLRNASEKEIEKLRTVRWMMDCGDDDSIISTNIDFYIEMRREKLPIELRIRNGNHNWVFWRESLPLILAFSFE